MNLKVIRGTEEYHRAGAYYVRIQAMARAHGIKLHEEFDSHDGSLCHYILVLDDDFPVATCRWFKAEPDVAEIGRVVVLPDYRGCGLGKTVILSAEEWIKDEGYHKIAISARDVAVDFYKKLGYDYNQAHEAHSGTFPCVYMEKHLNRQEPDKHK